MSISQSIYVGNLDYDIDEDDLRDIFSAYGKVVSVFRKEKASYAFVTMENEEGKEQVIVAIDCLDGKEVGGRPMTVDHARPGRRRIPPERP